MNSDRSKIFAVLLVKMALVLSVFVFTGFNHSVCAMPQESVTTEWVISERFTDLSQTFSFDITIENPHSKNGFNLFQIQNSLSKNYSCHSSLVVKTQAVSYLDFKAFLFKFFIPLYFSSSPTYNPNRAATVG